MTNLQLTDQKQRDRIATDTKATLFVEAGAGSGKTRSLVDRVATLVLDSGISLRRIAAVTFTNKAAAELRDRLRARLQQRVRDARAVIEGRQTASDAQRAIHDEAIRARDRANQALEDLDSATIGTLHSFAQQLLALHPIEAGLPPLIEVLDELTESMTSRRQWNQIRDSLFADPALRDTLYLAMDVELRLDDVEVLASQLTRDWDLIETRVALDAPTTVATPDLTGLLREAHILIERGAECSDPTDRFWGNLAALEEWSLTARAAVSVSEMGQVLSSGAKLKWGLGRKANWPNLDELRAACQDWQEQLGEIHSQLMEKIVRALVAAVARGVLRAADDRAATGRLTFQDVLVKARQLLTGDSPEASRVRASLQQRFQVLLLDEFQDTDPIQLEIAVRIAGGAAATAQSWQDVAVPDGSLFVVGDPKQSIYRFRRANIATYLRAQDTIGETINLTTNFRTVEPILTWVNTVCRELIQPERDAQPEYLALDTFRTEPATGAAVTLLGAEAHDKKELAADLRAGEVADVASVIAHALDDGWTIYDETAAKWRPIQPADIAILVPTGSVIPDLVDALSAVGISHNSTADSLTYEAQPIRDLLAAMRGIADPTDELSTVTALRSALFGCGDDDLWTWKQAGQRFTLSHPVPEELADNPVGAAMTYLGGLHRAAGHLSPSDILSRLATDRRVVELAATAENRRDTWRQVRYAIDQARAWSETEHGTLRGYLEWAGQQTRRDARVREPVLPEMDVDAVTISTVHSAKGLEYGMVVLAGMTSAPPTSAYINNVPRKPPVLWPPDGGVAISLRGALETSNYRSVEAHDKHLGELELRRLLYVATTRARDHLVVSLHRKATAAEAKPRTRAEFLVTAGALTAPGAARWSAAMASGDTTANGSLRRAPIPPPPEWTSWSEDIAAAQQHSARPAAVTASSLEGTVDGAGVGASLDDADDAVDISTLFEARVSGTAIGLAVHATLDAVDLRRYAAMSGAQLEADPELADILAAACAEHGVSQHVATVRALAHSALQSPTLARAAQRDYLKETWVGYTGADGTVVEGIVDLLYREDDGSVVVIDYKTDDVPDAALRDRAAFYQAQIDAYANAARAATGAEASAKLLFLRVGTPAVEVGAHA